MGGKRDDYMLDHILLGQGPDGRAQSVIPSQQVQMTVIDANGELVLGTVAEDEMTVGVFRETPLSQANIGFAPFFQHTTSSGSRQCSDCHRTADTPEEWARIRGVYGYGTGEFVLRNENGPEVDVLQFLDNAGNQLTEWVHLGTGPLPQDVRDRALAVEVPQ